jgi:CRP-like cAMP-binding protein
VTSDRHGVSFGGAWYAQLPATERSALHAYGTTRRYRAGTVLFHEGDTSDWVFLLSAGRVKVSSTTADGRDVVLAICVPGEILGELSAVDASPRSATATAIETVEARVVDGAVFRAFLASSAPAAVALLVAVCRRLRESDRRRVEFVAMDSVGRVAGRLVELSEQFGVAGPDGRIRIDVPITQDELAGWTGSSREAVSRALRTLRDRGWISTGRRTIIVVNPSGLRSRAN